MGLAVAGLLFAEAPSRTASLAFFTRATNIALVAAAALGGYAYRTHRAYVYAVEQRAEEAERSRETEAARRVEEERVRIAREVHDITAHSLSAVSIQAAAAERTLILETKYGLKTYPLDALIHLYLAEGEHKTDILEHLKEETL